MNESRPLISILVPMYNCEKTICRCLDSLKVQYPRIFEIIVLDDGSTDSGYYFVQNYEKKYNFIHAYHQENSGVASARQKLVELAQGEYIIFCDADDFLEPETVLSIFEVLKDDHNKNIDSIIYGYNLIREHGKKTIYRRKLKCGIYQKEAISRFHVNGLDDLYWSSLCNKCYKTELCRTPEIICFEKLMEDVIFNVDYLSRCKFIYVIDKSFYNYVQIGESLTRTKSADSRKAICEARKAYLLLIEKVLTTYPGEKRDVKKNEYIMTKRLMTRARQLNDKQLIEFLYKDMQKIKEKFGIRIYLLDCKYILNELKTQIKKFIKISIDRSFNPCMIKR